MKYNDDPRYAGALMKLDDAIHEQNNRGTLAVNGGDFAVDFFDLGDGLTSRDILEEIAATYTLDKQGAADWVWAADVYNADAE